MPAAAQKSMRLFALYVGFTMTLFVVVLGRPQQQADGTNYEYLISAFPGEKRAYAIDNVMSAMNNAARLRYGKRSSDGAGRRNLYRFVDTSLDLSEYPYAQLRGYEGGRSRWSNAKRFADEKQQSGFSASRLIDSLNGAERLRFGK